MSNPVAPKQTRKTRRPPEYLILTRSYWQGDTWGVAERNFAKRLSAEERMDTLSAEDWDTNSTPEHGYDTSRGRNFRVVSFTIAKQLKVNLDE